jgi:acetolactate synthase I/II/III large subunit
MTVLTGGQALARQLVLEGTRHVFALPGVQLDWAIDALIDVAPGLRCIVPRHEQATSYMADGYARASGRPGVCMMVPGPGVLNAMAGLATAYACSSPVVCIAGQIHSSGIGRGFGMLHEVRDQSQLLTSVTKWSALARTPADIPRLIHEAFRQAQSGRPRPVAVEIPPDVLQASAPLSPADARLPSSPAGPAAADIDAAAQWLAAAAAPCIWVGGGVVAANATESLKDLAERLDAPVVMSDNGRGALSDRHPLALPSLGGRALFPHADVILVVGSRSLNLRAQPIIDAPQARFVYLNVDEADMSAPRPQGLHLVGDAKMGLLALAAAITPRRHGAASTCALVRAWCDTQLATIEPQRSWLRSLRRAIPDDGVLVNELTQVGYLAPLAYPVYEPRTFLTPGYQGTLGYGFPTGLGAAVGLPGRTVVSITGDGGFGWSLQELATAARYEIPLITVVFADGAFGNVRRIQREVFGREFGTELKNPDFMLLARAFDVDAVRAETPEALEDTLRSAIASPRGPLLIEVPVGEMPSPWHLIHRLSKYPHPEPANPLDAPPGGTAAWGVA